MERQPGDDPVFLDRTGHRRRLIAVAGSIGGLVLTLILLALVAGFTGAGPAAVPGWPDAAAGGARNARPEHSSSRTPAPLRSQPDTARPALTGQTPDRRPTPAATTPISPAAGTPTPPVSATPTPKNNGRKPSHTPNPHSSKKG